LALGGTGSGAVSFYNQKDITGSTTAYSNYTVATVQPDVTQSGIGYRTGLRTAAASFTLSTLAHYWASQSTIGAGSTVTQQIGFYVDSSLTGATNNYGFQSGIASGTGRWNFYAAGTADNYFAGNVGIGTATPNTNLTILGSTASDSGISLTTSANDATDGPIIQFGRASSNGNIGNIRGGRESSGGFLTFATRDTGGVATTERMRITAAGNVGIGTATPYSKFHVDTGGVTTSAGGVTLRNASNQAHHWYLSDNVTSVFEVGSSAGVFRWINGNGELMRINSSGNVGIGTTSPNVDYKLHVAGNILATGTVRIEGANIRVSGGGSAALPSIQPGEDADTGMYWGGSNTIGFSTGGTRRAEITSEGVLLTFANSSANYGIYMANANASPLGIRSTYTGAAPNGTGNVFYLASDTAGTKFTVRSNGGIANFQANNANLSDRREKKDFEPCGNYLEKLCQIPVQKFRYLNQAPEDDGLSIGVVAQDVQEVFPELVMESDWSNGEEGSEPRMRLSIYQTDLQYVMMKCIQEQQTMIEELRAEIQLLKTQ
jgi:hypothetical protein